MFRHTSLQRSRYLALSARKGHTHRKRTNDLYYTHLNVYHPVLVFLWQFAMSSSSYGSAIVVVLVVVVVGTALATKPVGHVAPAREPDPHPPRYAYDYAVNAADSSAATTTLWSSSSAFSSGVAVSAADILLPAANTSSTATVGQGHRETRNGDNTHGNYYVNFADGLTQQSVQYVADDWGYHPVVK